jgi:Kef-type K+ transport system membrane component KefB
MRNVGRIAVGVVRASVIAAIATALVVVTSGAENSGWVIAGLLNALVCVWAVPRLVELVVKRRTRTQSVVQVGLAECCVALFMLPGLAAFVGAHPDVGWRIGYLGLSVLGCVIVGWVIGWCGPNEANG